MRRDVEVQALTEPEVPLRSGPARSSRPAPAAPANAPLPSRRLDDVHRLRAIVILQIVLLHALAGGLSVQRDGSFVPVPSALLYTLGRSLGALVELAFHGATTFFVLISGIVFARVYATRPVSRFYRSRATNVAAPYVVATVVLTLLWRKPPWSSPRFFAELGELPRVAVENLFTGRADYHLWYIPVAIILFALAPLLHRVATAPRLAPLAVAIIAAPLVVSRDPRGTPLQQAVYFGGAYLIGMIAGQDVPRMRAVAARHLKSFALVAALASLALALVAWAEVPRLGFTSLRESLYYVQKLALFPVLLHLAGGPVARLGAAGPRVLDYFAERSLALYFVHQPVITILLDRIVRHRLGVNGVSMGTWIASSLVAAVLSVGISVAIIEATRRLFPRYSRLLLGA